MEFGSDFHIIEDFNTDIQGYTLPHFYNEALYFALGRHALEGIILQERLQTLWIPSYYCHESIQRIKSKMDVKFYDNSPLENPIEVVKNLPLSAQDGILLMNYFGLWGGVRTPDLNAILIEDHSHDLLSPWARNSTADYCFASLRKSLPIAEGGILWSKKNLSHFPSLQDTEFHLKNACARQCAMKLKSDYLIHSNKKTKEHFLRLYRETENNFETMEISPLLSSELNKLNIFNIKEWYLRKLENWNSLYRQCNNLKDCHIVGYGNAPLSVEGITPFALILRFNTAEKRDNVRKVLIENEIYPAILWTLPEEINNEFEEFSETMLSVHCDGRYNGEDIMELGTKLSSIINSVG